MPWAGFEPAIPANKRPQTYALDGEATGINTASTLGYKNVKVALFLHFALMFQTQIYKNIRNVIQYLVASRGSVHKSTLAPRPSLIYCAFPSVFLIIPDSSTTTDI
jgi:hypothetical protein